MVKKESNVICVDGNGDEIQFKRGVPRPLWRLGVVRIQDECVTLVPRKAGSVDLVVRGGSQVGYEGVETRRLELDHQETVRLGKYRWYLSKETTTAVIVQGLGQKYEVRLNGDGY